MSWKTGTALNNTIYFTNSNYMETFLIIICVISGILFFKSLDNNNEKETKIFFWAMLIAGGLAFYTHSEKQKQALINSSRHSPSQIHFGGSNGFKHYPCPVGGCLCTKYEAKGVYNSDCKNCGHPKHPSKY